MFSEINKFFKVAFLFVTGVCFSSVVFASVGENNAKSIRSFPSLSALLDRIDTDAGNDCVVGRVYLKEGSSLDESNVKGCKLVSPNEAVDKVSSFFKSAISHFGYDEEYLESIGASDWKLQVEQLIGQQDYFNCAVYDVDVNLASSDLNYSLDLHIEFEE